VENPSRAVLIQGCALEIAEKVGAENLPKRLRGKKNEKWGLGGRRGRTTEEGGAGSGTKTRRGGQRLPDGYIDRPVPGFVTVKLREGPMGGVDG